MQVFLQESGKNLWESGLGFSDTAVALGGFDAMHIGHLAIIRKVVETAKREGLTSLVYFFVNQPKSVLDGREIPYVNPLAKRLEILQELGVEIAVAEEFTPEYLKISPEVFVEDYLKKRLGARYGVAGFNYRFGRCGRGDLALLEELGGPLGIRVCGVPCVTVQEEPVSSTRIRRLIAGGKMEEAAKCLGRWFSVEGQVVPGHQVGRAMEFPTANLELPKELLLPGFGVYLTETKVEEKWYPSITNVGARPTVGREEPCIESHLLDFSGDLYGKEIAVRFRRYLREIVQFESIEQLKQQLEKDKIAVQQALL